MAFAGPIPGYERVNRKPRMPGQDSAGIQIHGNQEDFDNGVYYFRIDVRAKRLVNYRLPSVTFSNYCGHHRSPGGSVGDYKPKSILNSISIMFNDVNDRVPFWSAGSIGQDYNETPVNSRIGEFHPRGTRIDIPSDSRLMTYLLYRCAKEQWVRIYYKTTNSCRWKPEIWHKPEIWKAEYEFPLLVTVGKTVWLHCVNR